MQNFWAADRIVFSIFRNWGEISLLPTSPPPPPSSHTPMGEGDPMDHPLGQRGCIYISHPPIFMPVYVEFMKEKYCLNYELFLKITELQTMLCSEKINTFINLYTKIIWLFVSYQCYTLYLTTHSIYRPWHTVAVFISRPRKGEGQGKGGCAPFLNYRSACKYTIRFRMCPLYYSSVPPFSALCSPTFFRELGSALISSVITMDFMTDKTACLFWHYFVIYLLVLL